MAARLIDLGPSGVGRLTLDADNDPVLEVFTPGTEDDEPKHTVVWGWTALTDLADIIQEFLPEASEIANSRMPEETSEGPF